MLAIIPVEQKGGLSYLVRFAGVDIQKSPDGQGEWFLQRRLSITDCELIDQRAVYADRQCLI